MRGNPRECGRIGDRDDSTPRRIAQGEFFTMRQNIPRNWALLTSRKQRLSRLDRIITCVKKFKFNAERPRGTPSGSWLTTGNLGRRLWASSIRRKATASPIPVPHSVPFRAFRWLNVPGFLPALRYVGGCSPHDSMPTKHKPSLDQPALPSVPCPDSRRGVPPGRAFPLAGSTGRTRHRG